MQKKNDARYRVSFEVHLCEDRDEDDCTNFDTRKVNEDQIDEAIDYPFLITPGSINIECLADSAVGDKVPDAINQDINAFLYGESK